jgi:hypothetical protein
MPKSLPTPGICILPHMTAILDERNCSRNQVEAVTGDLPLPAADQNCRSSAQGDERTSAVETPSTPVNATNNGRPGDLI